MGLELGPAVTRTRKGISAGTKTYKGPSNATITLLASVSVLASVQVLIPSNSPSTSPNTRPIHFIVPS